MLDTSDAEDGEKPAKKRAKKRSAPPTVSSVASLSQYVAETLGSRYSTALPAVCAKLLAEFADEHDVRESVMPACEGEPADAPAAPAAAETVVNGGADQPGQGRTRVQMQGIVARHLYDADPARKKAKELLAEAKPPSRERRSPEGAARAGGGAPKRRRAERSERPKARRRLDAEVNAVGGPMVPYEAPKKPELYKDKRKRTMPPKKETRRGARPPTGRRPCPTPPCPHDPPPHARSKSSTAIVPRRTTPRPAAKGNVLVQQTPSRSHAAASNKPRRTRSGESTPHRAHVPRALPSPRLTRASPRTAAAGASASRQYSVQESPAYELRASPRLLAIKFKGL